MTRCDRLIKGDQIFISYKSEEANKIEWFKYSLESLNYNVWLDADRLPANVGEQWTHILEQQIRESKVFLAFLTYDYFFVSTVCPKELEEARKHHKFIISIILEEQADDAKRTQFYDELKRRELTDFQMAKVTQPGDVSKHVPHIINQLKRQGVRRHVRAQRNRAITALLGLILATILIFVLVQFYMDWRAPQPPANPLTLIRSTQSPVLRLAQGPDGKVYYATKENGHIVVNTLQSTQSVHDFGVSDDVRRLHVDCKGTIWILLQGQTTGVFTYPGDFTVANQAQLQKIWNLSGPDQFALDSYCPSKDKPVEVWLGSDSVHTIQYSGKQPAIGDALPTDKDEVFKAISDQLQNYRPERYFADIRFLDGKIWVLEQYNRRVVSIDRLNGNSVASYDTNNPGNQLSFLSTLFMASGTSGLFQMNPTTTHFDKILDMPIDRLAASSDFLWLGSASCKAASNCQSLALYYRNQVRKYETDFYINDIILSTDHRVLFATSDGIYVYPRQT